MEQHVAVACLQEASDAYWYALNRYVEAQLTSSVSRRRNRQRHLNAAEQRLKHTLVALHIAGTQCQQTASLS